MGGGSKWSFWMMRADEGDILSRGAVGAECLEGVCC